MAEVPTHDSELSKGSSRKRKNAHPLKCPSPNRTMEAGGSPLLLNGYREGTQALIHNGECSNSAVFPINAIPHREESCDSVNGTPTIQQDEHTQIKIELGLEGVKDVDSEKSAFVSVSANGVPKCSICDYEHLLPSGVELHSIVHLHNAPYKCRDCGFLAHISPEFNRHITLKHDVERYHCIHPSCDYKTGIPINASRHIQSHSDHICKVCSEPFSTETALLCHMKEHYKINNILPTEGDGTSNSTPTNSPLCQLSQMSHGFAVESKEQTFHKKVFPLSGSPLRVKYECTICPYISNHRSNMRRHCQNYHHDPERFREIHCSMNRQNSSEYHQQSSSQASSVHGCSRPSNSVDITGENTMEDTLSTGRTREMIRYICNVCSYSSLYCSNTHRHCKLRHGNGLLFRKDSNTVTMSLLRGNEDRDSAIESRCKFCDYKSNVNLRRHYRKVHTSSKCPNCDYSTNHDKSLMVHSRQCVGGEGNYSPDDDGIYQCLCCFYSTTDRISWLSHECTGLPIPNNSNPLLKHVPCYSSLNSHKETVPSSPIESNNPATPGTGETSLATLKSHHSLDLQHCPICKIVVINSESMDAHMRTHASNPQAGDIVNPLSQMATIDPRSPAFSTYSNPGSHTTVDCGQMGQLKNKPSTPALRPYQCKTCGYMSSNLSNSYRHVRKKHQEFDLDIIRKVIVKH